MIHMLSNFDLKEGISFETFEEAYADFVSAVIELGLVVNSDKVGRRVRNTSMDTAGDDEPEFYSVMRFRDREKLDAAYDHFLGIAKEKHEQITHSRIHQMIENPVFICWQDES